MWCHGQHVCFPCTHTPATIVSWSACLLSLHTHTHLSPVWCHGQHVCFPCTHTCHQCGVMVSMSAFLAHTPVTSVVSWSACLLSLHTHTHTHLSPVWCHGQHVCFPCTHTCHQCGVMVSMSAFLAHTHTHLPPVWCHGQHVCFLCTHTHTCNQCGVMVSMSAFLAHTHLPPVWCHGQHVCFPCTHTHTHNCHQCGVMVSMSAFLAHTHTQLPPVWCHGQHLLSLRTRLQPKLECRFDSQMGLNFWALVCGLF